MPSNANYVRDHDQERKTAIKRGETSVGSKSSDATRHRARRAYMKRNGALNSNTHVDHKNPLKSGGSNELSNLTTKTASSNTSHGGKIGNRAGKKAGALKGHKSRKKNKTA
jgi:hypothetical protein